jgi:hypothetical protein
MRPAYITAMRSANPANSAGSWLIPESPCRVADESATTATISACKGRVEFAGRFVGDQKSGPARNRLRNCDPLALASAELMRISGIDFVRVIETNLTQQLHDSLPALPGVERQVRAQDLANLRSAVITGLSARAPDLAGSARYRARAQTQFRLRQIQQIAAAKSESRPAFRPVRRQQPQQCTRQRAFAATGFSQYSDDFSGANVDANAIQRAKWRRRLPTST